MVQQYRFPLVAQCQFLLACLNLSNMFQVILAFSKSQN